MFGPPKDREGECNAHLYLGDDYGDNNTTVRCSLPKGHEGDHCKAFCRTGDETAAVQITWVRDERCWHEWLEVGTPAAREAFLRVSVEEDGEIPSWAQEEYEDLVGTGRRLLCSKCLITSEEAER